ncbi:MAG: hypothetical protein ACREH8_12130 [Opitutaceae bacterium]
MRRAEREVRGERFAARATVIAAVLKIATTAGRRIFPLHTASLDQAVCGSEQIGVLRVALDRGGEARRREHLVEGVADVLELVIKLVAMMLEPVLQAF